MARMGHDNMRAAMIYQYAVQRADQVSQKRARRRSEPALPAPAWAAQVSPWLPPRWPAPVMAVRLRPAPTRSTGPRSPPSAPPGPAPGGGDRADRYPADAAVVVLLSVCAVRVAPLSMPGRRGRGPGTTRPRLPSHHPERQPRTPQARLPRHVPDGLHPRWGYLIPSGAVGAVGLVDRPIVDLDGFHEGRAFVLGEDDGVLTAAHLAPAGEGESLPARLLADLRARRPGPDPNHLVAHVSYTEAPVPVGCVVTRIPDPDLGITVKV